MPAPSSFLASAYQSLDERRDTVKLGIIAVFAVTSLVFTLFLVVTRDQAYALSLYGADITLVSPPSLRMPEAIRSDLFSKGTSVRETNDLSVVVNSVDVLYMTRIQRERFPDPQEYNKVARCYRLTPESLVNARKNLIIMHPLPRVDEISPAVDGTPHARYFQQSFYGVTVRMALLKMLIGGGA